MTAYREPLGADAVSGVSLAPVQFPLDGADISYFPNVFAQAETASLLEELASLSSWQRRPIIKRDWQTGERLEVLEGRPTISFSSPPGMRYQYSGSWREAEAFPDAVLRVKERVEALLAPLFAEWSPESGRALAFNYCLANLYENGRQAVGKHADDEKDILRRSPIATVSFGVTREFVLESKNDYSKTLKLNLEAGSVMVMAGRTQENYVHSISKDKRLRQPRISLTFRINH